MSFLKNQEIYFTKLVPSRPDKNKLDPTKPNWNLQCRTTDKEMRKEWVEMGFRPRVVREDPADEESKVLYYSINIRKNAIKVLNGVATPAAPVTVVNGKHEDVDPTSIGNGSIANIRLFRRDYELAGVKKVAYTLMGVQLIKHKVYISVPMEDFEDCETETVLPDAPNASSDSEDLY